MKNATFPKSVGRLPALVAVGGSLATLPAAAVELGELTVHSRLGDPLRASIAVALGPNEAIDRSCVTVAPIANGWPGVGPATVAVGNGVITLTGRAPMREPMVSTRLVVNCPYSANISREYMLFIDPPTYVAPRVAEVTVSPPVAAAVAVAPSPAGAEPVAEARPAPRQPRAVPTDIVIADRYQVQPGDSVSEIAQRIEGRTMKLWPAVYALVDANPDAFIDGDPNRLKAGSWLDIPAAIGGAVSSADIAATDVSESEAAIDTPAVETTTDTTVVTESASAAETTAATADPVAAEPVDTTADLQPGDIIVNDNPFVEPTAAGETTTVIPDTRLDGPETSATSPNVTTAVVVPKAEVADSDSPNWLYWLGGAGLAVIIGLLFFGRRLRKTPEPLVPAPAHPMRRATDTETVEAIVVEETEYNIEDDSPTEENLVLDADLVTGSGLEQGTDMDVNQDFGFAATTELDVELPFEPESPVASDETDILPPPMIDESSILDSEVMPEDDEYDMSVIVDATKMPQVEEVTERDLKAVEILPDDETMIADNSYTISKEVDYEILEQDYEDELTATQALNEEIARAAAELAERLEDGDVDPDESGETAVLPMTSVSELDVTAEMPAANSDEVVELDATAEIAVDSEEDEDETANMQLESGKLG